MTIPIRQIQNEFQKINMKNSTKIISLIAAILWIIGSSLIYNKESSNVGIIIPGIIIAIGFTRQARKKISE